MRREESKVGGLVDMILVTKGKKKEKEKKIEQERRVV